MGSLSSIQSIQASKTAFKGVNCQPLACQPLAAQPLECQPIAGNSLKGLEKDMFVSSKPKAANLSFGAKMKNAVNNLLTK